MEIVLIKFQKMVLHLQLVFLLLFIFLLGSCNMEKNSHQKESKVKPSKELKVKSVKSNKDSIPTHLKRIQQRLGTKEIPDNTNSDNGNHIDSINKEFGLKKEPWCAMEVSNASKDVTYPKLWSARALGLTKHCLISLKDVQFGIYKPKRGDVLVYDYDGSKGHVDLIVNYDTVKKEFELIGGNRANAVRTLKMTLQKAILKGAKYVIMITPIKPIEAKKSVFRYDTLIKHVTWYGGYFHNRKTANGERYDTTKYTAAHKTLPFNTIVKVINPKNNKSVNVRINDRCPKKNVLDLTPKAIRQLGISSQKCYMVIRYEK